MNSCSTSEELLALNGKLARFECMVQDMYDEEFFIQVLKPKDPDASLESTILYKYYSELSPEQMQTYEVENID